MSKDMKQKDQKAKGKIVNALKWACRVCACVFAIICFVVALDAGIRTENYDWGSFSGGIFGGCIGGACAVICVYLTLERTRKEQAVESATIVYYDLRFAIDELKDYCEIADKKEMNVYLNPNWTVTCASLLRNKTLNKDELQAIYRLYGEVECVIDYFKKNPKTEAISIAFLQNIGGKAILQAIKDIYNLPGGEDKSYMKLFQKLEKDTGAGFSSDKHIH